MENCNRGNAEVQCFRVCMAPCFCVCKKDIMANLIHKESTDRIIGSAIKVHKTLGPGFVERLYQRALYLELKNNKIPFEREKKITVRYNNAVIGYEQVDFDIDKTVLVELKAVTEILPLHKAQLLSYLKASERKLGLIINFAKEKIEVKRVILSKK